MCPGLMSSGKMPPWILMRTGDEGMSCLWVSECSASSRNQPCKITSHVQPMPQLPSLDFECDTYDCMLTALARMTQSYSPYSQIRHNAAHVPVPISLAPRGAFAARLAIVNKVLRCCLVRGRLSITATPASTPAELGCAVAVLHFLSQPQQC